MARPENIRDQFYSAVLLCFDFELNCNADMVCFLLNFNFSTYSIRTNAIFKVERLR